MEQADPHRDGVDRRSGRRGGRRVLAWLLMVLLVGVALLAVAWPLVSRWYDDSPRSQPVLRPERPPSQVRSVSIDFGLVVDPDTDWEEVAARLDSVGATTVDLAAGRVEFTAFDWDAHPEVAATPGTDHLRVASRALDVDAQGRQREVNLIVDAFIPAWLEASPELAGRDVAGKRATYMASASQLYDGEVGDRLVDYVAALGERYDPNGIIMTELYFGEFTFGDEDLDLYRRLTGSADWPRTPDGAVDQDSPEIGAWRSEVLAHLLGRMRNALDAVRGGAGREIGLTMDVRVDWVAPPAGRPDSGHDYGTLGAEVDQLQLWAYLGRRSDTNRDPAAIEELTAALRAAGFDMSTLSVSVGLWTKSEEAEPPGTLPSTTLAQAVSEARSNGVAAVNVTPYSLMTPDHWEALGTVWRE